MIIAFLIVALNLAVWFHAPPLAYVAIVAVAAYGVAAKGRRA